MGFLRLLDEEISQKAIEKKGVVMLPFMGRGCT